MPRNYVDNAMNRRLGRAGMPVGSMPVSSGCGGGGFSSGWGSTKTYVDNSMNRSLGRVGMPHGSMVVSKSGSGSGDDCFRPHSSPSTKTYVDNSSNRSLGRVGMPHGSMVVSKSGARDASPSSTKTYVDNSYNRSIGRVGLPHGSMVVSKGSSVASETYVDNRYNRALGRDGMPRGSMVVSKSRNDYGRSSPVPKHVANAKTYKDNYSNRLLDRVGLPLGSAKASTSVSAKTYVDNSLNRSLGRVGLPRGSLPVSRMSQTTNATRDMYQHIKTQPFEEIQFDSYGIDEEQQIVAHDVATSLINRMEEVLKWQSEKKTTEPPRTSGPLLGEYRGKIIEFEEIKLQRKIGSGGFGDVFFAKWKSSVVAAKKLRVQRVSKRRLKEFTKEIMLLCELDHMNIVKFIGACVDTPNLCIVMEYMQMSLFEALHVRYDIEFSEEDQIQIIQQTACGLDYLHSSNIAHCDMKSQNVLLDYEEGESIVAKITDFGLSIMKNDAETSMSSSADVVRNIGTPRYSAPEILRGEFLKQEELKMADVYSFSLIMFEVVTEEEPFYNMNYPQLIRHIGDKGMTPDIPANPTLDTPVECLLRHCWAREPLTRPTALEVMRKTCRLDKIYNV